MKLFSKMLLVLMISFSLVELPIMKSSVAHAGMISTTEAVAHLSRTQGEKSVSEFLGRSDVKDQLIKLGVTPAEATLRLASLTDSEVKSLAHDINEASAGSSIGGVLVLVLIILLVIYFAKRF
jgi:hypothetical protein